MTDLERISLYFRRGYYTAGMLDAFVRAGVITEEEKAQILGGTL